MRHSTKPRFVNDANPLRNMSEDIDEKQHSSRVSVTVKIAKAREKTRHDMSLLEPRPRERRWVVVLADQSLALVVEPPLQAGDKWPRKTFGSRYNPGIMPRRTEGLGRIVPKPWTSSIDATSPEDEVSVYRKSSRDLAHDPGQPNLTSTLERESLYVANTWSGNTWTRFKSYAARVLSGAHALVSNSSSLLTTACLLGSIPHVAGAPHSQDSRGKAMLDTAHDIESFMIGLGSILVTVAPVVIWLATAARLWYILRWHTRELAHPVYSGALAIMAGIAYGAVRRAVGEAASKEETILAVFVACWTSFVADSRRKVNNKQQYFLRVVFGGGIACLLVTAVQFIDQEPHKVAQQTATTPLNQSTGVGQTFEPGALGSQEATTFLTMAKTNAPFLLIITSVAIYIWQMYIEVGPRSTPTTHAAP